MKDRLNYSRWILTITFFSLIGLLAVSMMTVHWKREIRSVGGGIGTLELDLEKLERRQDTMDNELAHALNPEHLKGLVAVSNLRLAPPQESRIIVVRSKDIPFEGAYFASLDRQPLELASRWEPLDRPGQGKD
jgi:hypothetical protein